MTRDFFIHLGETLDISVQLIDNTNQPINLANTVISMAVSMELDTDTVQTITSANSQQISIIDANNALVEIKFTPRSNTGFYHGTHVYQLKADNATTSTTYLEGKIFISPSLFD